VISRFGDLAIGIWSSGDLVITSGDVVIRDLAICGSLFDVQISNGQIATFDNQIAISRDTYRQIAKSPDREMHLCVSIFIFPLPSASSAPPPSRRP
jgi:hypothetical protein